MKRYEKYKNSKVEWIGDLPEHWKSIRLKRLSNVKRGASPRPIDDPKFFDDKGEFAWVRIADVTASERYLESTTQTLSELGSSLSVKRYPGDFFLSIAGTVGKPIITKIKCCIHDGFVYFPSLKINPEYLYYIFSTGLPYQGLGKLGTQLNLNTESIGEIFIPVPNENEIKSIIIYLDQRIELIDKLIATKQQLIELLKEERTAIINHAVINGLNPKVKRKPSGIAWLGEIPEHWKVKKLKYIALIKYGLGQPPKQKDNGLPLIRATNVKTGKITEKDLMFVDPDDIPYDRDPVLKENDIIVVRSGAYTADSAIIPKKYEGAITGYDMVVRVTQDNPIFISYCLLSNYVLINQLYLNKLRAAQPHLNKEELGETFLIMPNWQEQIEIVRHLESQTKKIDLTISKIEMEIELMQEYRIALISEVVTGKIKVI